MVINAWQLETPKVMLGAFEPPEAPLSQCTDMYQCAQFQHIIRHDGSFADAWIPRFVGS